MAALSVAIGVLTRPALQSSRTKELNCGVVFLERNRSRKKKRRPRLVPVASVPCEPGVACAVRRANDVGCGARSTSRR